MANNIARAIELETNGMGIAPESSETFTRSVEVESSIYEVNIKRDIV